jgi:uncharacterized protein
MDYRFSLAGLVVGTFVGLSGVGGSAILAPVLILLLGVKPSIAIGTDLLYSVPTKILALALHARQKTVDWTVTRNLLWGGIPGGLVGLGIYALLQRSIPDTALQPILRHAIGIAILIACVGAAILWFRRGRERTAFNDTADLQTPLSAAMTVAIGAIVGILVSVTSVGSGSVTLPLLILVFPRVILRRLIGSEIAFAAFLVPLAAAGHVGFGNANWPMVLALVIGSLPGVWLGSALCRITGDSWLRPVILGVLAFAGSRLM